MDIIRFIKDKINDINADYEFKINSELNYNFEKGKDNVVLRLQQGNRYKKGVVIPISILITSEDILEAFNVWSAFVSVTSDQSYVEGVDSYYFMLMTPTLQQFFDEIGNNYQGVVSVMGTIVQTSNTDDIKKIEINKDDFDEPVEIDVIDSAFSFTNVIDQAQVNTNLNSADASGAVLTLIIDTYIDVNEFFNTLFLMRRGTVPNDAVFNLTITWISGQVETFDAIITNHSFTKSRGALSKTRLEFAYFKEVEVD